MLVFEVSVDGYNPCICKTMEEAMETAGVEDADDETLDQIVFKVRRMREEELAALPEHEGW